MKYVYKVLTHEQWLKFQEDKVFNGSELDRKDNFLHFSTKKQVLGVLNRYFPDSKTIILKFEQKKYQSILKWEGKQPDNLFPHIYCESLKIQDVVETLEKKDFLLC